jgi:hypothetical protein
MKLIQQIKDRKWKSGNWIITSFLTYLKLNKDIIKLTCGEDLKINKIISVLDGLRKRIIWFGEINYFTTVLTALFSFEKLETTKQKNQNLHNRNLSFWNFFSLQIT